MVICLDESLDGFPVVAPQQLLGLPEEEATATQPRTALSAPCKHAFVPDTGQA